MVEEPRRRDLDRPDEMTVREQPARRDDVDLVRREAPRTTETAAMPPASAGAAVDRVRWGPIVGGIVATVATLLLLNLLGLAVGLSVLDPASPEITDLGTAAGIWGALAALIAFFIGGWLAGRSTAPSATTASAFPGLVNGALVWATTLVFLLLLGAIGAGGAFGFVGASFDNIANALGLGDVSTGEALTAARNSAWGTIIALVLTLATAMAGGWVGQRSQPYLPAVNR